MQEYKERGNMNTFQDKVIIVTGASEGIGRALFCTLPGRELMVLNTFIKKSKKTPQKELELARKRMREVSK